MLLGRLHSASAALTVVITATIDRRRSVQVLLKRWHVFVGLGPLGSETLRPRTSPLGEPSTQDPPPAPFGDRLCVSRDFQSDIDIIAQIGRTGIDRPGLVTLSLPRADTRRRSGGLEAHYKAWQRRIKALKGVFPPGDQAFSRARSIVTMAV